MSKPNKVHTRDIIDTVAEITGLDTKTAKKALHAVLYAIQGAVAKGDKVQFRSFGTFEVVHRPAHTGRNPSTGDPVDVPDSWRPKFTPGVGFVGLVQQTQQEVNS